MLSSIVVPAASKHTASVIFLHGLGDSGHGWAPVAEMLAPLLPHATFILPNAPQQPVSINMGMKMPSWFDIYSLGEVAPTRHDERGLLQSVEAIKSIVQDQINKGIPASRIVVGGFSQGGAISLLYSCLSETKHAGFLCLSGFLPMPDSVPKMLKLENQSTPLLMCHGDADDVVGFKWGVMSREKLESFGKEGLSFKTYSGMGHSTCNEEIRDVAGFLQKVIP